MVEKDNTKLVNESEEVKLSTKMGKKLAPDRSLFRILMAIFTFIRFRAGGSAQTVPSLSGGAMGFSSFSTSITYRD